MFLVNVGLFCGYLITFFYNAITNPDVFSSSWVLNVLLSGWITQAPVLTLLCLLAFIVSGVYARRSIRRLRWKVAYLLQSIGLSYLFCALAFYLFHTALRSVVPTTAALLGLALSCLLVAGARVGKQMLSKVYIIEPRLGPKSQGVEYVLVIGGAGYIGSVLTRQLLRARYRVRVLDSLMFGDQAIRNLYGHPHFELVVGDFRNLETIARAMRGMDAVIHLGAIVGDPACALDTEYTLSVNTDAVRMIRDISCGYGIQRFLFASTCSVYGAQTEVIKEQSTLAPVSVYAQSKIAAEQSLLEMKQEGFQPTILRLATAFGLSHRMRFDLVANLLTARALSKGEITIFNGDQWRPFIHVNDIARAFMACLEAPPELVAGQIFNAGDNNANLTLKELGDLVAKAVPSTKISYQNISSDPRSYRVDFSKITQTLGFRCQTTVAEAIQQMADAIRTGTFGEYEDVIYNNAASLKAGKDQLWANVGSPGSPKSIRIDPPANQPTSPRSALAAAG
jgi:nucleoside-diphosphate-sugar epimerase